VLLGLPSELKQPSCPSPSVAGITTEYIINFFSLVVWCLNSGPFAREVFYHLSHSTSPSKCEVECLLCKCEALSLKPSTAQNHYREVWEENFFSLIQKG
jgi:hypothetical protein